MESNNKTIHTKNNKWRKSYPTALMGGAMSPSLGDIHKLPSGKLGYALSKRATTIGDAKR
jgi:hypothetical protein